MRKCPPPWGSTALQDGDGTLQNDGENQDLVSEFCKALAFVSQMQLEKEGARHVAWHSLKPLVKMQIPTGGGAGDSAFVKPPRGGSLCGTEEHTPPR